MKIYLDTANIEKLEGYLGAYNLDGFTCNPTICARDNADIDKLLTIVPDKMAFYQVTQEDYQGILEDADKILAARSNAIIKIPVTADGLKAIKTLTEKGVPVLATAIYTCLQGILAAQAGAQYLAPYTNRMSDMGNDGVKVVLELVAAIKNQGLNTEVVAASFKNLSQLNDLLVGGCHSVTIPVDLFEKMISNDLTSSSVKSFSKDWENCYNRKTFL